MSGLTCNGQNAKTTVQSGDIHVICSILRLLEYLTWAQYEGRIGKIRNAYVYDMWQTNFSINYANITF